MSKWILIIWAWPFWCLIYMTANPEPRKNEPPAEAIFMHYCGLVIGLIISSVVTYQWWVAT